MNAFEVRVKSERQCGPERRLHELPFSTLSWHEHQLNDLEMRARRKAAQRNVGAMRMSVRVINAFKTLAKSTRSARVQTTVEDGEADSVKPQQQDTPSALSQSLGVLIPRRDGAQHVTSYTSVTASESRDELTTIDEQDAPATHPLLTSYTDMTSQPPPRPGTSHTLRSASHPDFIRIPTARPHTRSESRLGAASSEYLENFSGTASRAVRPATKSVLRPLSAPYKMLTKYRDMDVTSRPSSRASLPTSLRASPRCTLQRPATAHTTHPHASRPHTRSAPTLRRVGSASARVSQVQHRARCPAPHPHTVDTCNTFSAINGPHTSTDSLLLGKPRDTYQHVRHTCAWYHVPGRYITPDQPYPPKRSQQRVDEAQRKLVSRLHSRSHGLLRT